ncbi:hypothetical protein PS2_035127 [Malus domestica]
MLIRRRRPSPNRIGTRARCAATINTRHSATVRAPQKSIQNCPAQTLTTCDFSFSFFADTSSVGINSTVEATELVGLAVSSVGINSTAARTIDYLPKSRSRRVSESLLVEVISSAFSAKFESPRGRDVFLSRPQSQDAEVNSATQRNINKFTPRPSSADELARPAFTEGRS